MPSKKKPPSDKNGWLVTYADVATLLLCFFVFLSASGVQLSDFVEPVETAVIEIGAEDLPAGPPPVTPEVTSESPAAETETSALEKVAADIAEAFGRLSARGAEVEIVGGEYVRAALPGDILFEADSAELNGSARALLMEVAAALSGYPGSAVEIEGHADDLPVLSGQWKDNWVLSCARAAGVAAFFAENGVDPARLKPVGYGEWRPRESNGTPEGREKNRRVEIKVIGGNADITNPD
ncbi:MAG: OmpA family protein [Clostridiales bacterium]|jgi:chemotaxis protein MotB|nr:OmpA family protein [Clostridiales bacterium]